MNEPRFIKVYGNEAEYRADDSSYNYSKLKDFDKQSLLAFRKKYVLQKEDKTNGTMDFGNLVHVKLSEDEEYYDKNFYLSKIYKLPEPQEVKFVDNLLGLTLDCTKDGVVTRDFSELCHEAYELSEIKKPMFPTFIGKFEGGVMESYYQELRNAAGRKLVTLKDLELCDRVIDKGKNSPTVGEIIRWKDRLCEVPIQFEYMGYTFRVLIDRINLDHKNKRASRFDWKITHATDKKEFSYNYLDMKYYIQDFLYDLGSRCYLNHFYPDYDLEPFKYVAIHNEAYSDSTLHHFNYGIENPWVGFTHRGKRYKGIQEIIENMNWHIENNVWSMRKETYQNKGICEHFIGE